MRTAPLSLLSILSLLQIEHGKAATKESSSHTDILYSYFETILDKEIGPTGPSNWRENKWIPDNQCGGYGQKNGFGQSPVLLPFEATCQGNLSSFEFDTGNCTYGDLTFSLQTDGAYINSPSDGRCHMGSIKIPHKEDTTFFAEEVRFILDSEHYVDGTPKSFAEIQIFHKNKEYDKIVALSKHVTFIQVSTEFDHWVHHNSSNEFNFVLAGWERDFNDTLKHCRDLDENLDFNPLKVMRKQQSVWECFGDEVDAVDTANEIWSEAVRTHNFPQKAEVDIPEDKVFPVIVDIYRSITQMMVYKGSMTKPPCTENVYWLLANPYIYGDDHPSVFVSTTQHMFFKNMLLCFVEKSSCKYASAASEFGSLARPAQPLNDRSFALYCNSVEGGNDENNQEVVELKEGKAKKYKKIKPIKIYYAVLFPVFFLVVGGAAYFLKTRALEMVPYTAILFLAGTVTGMCLTEQTDYLTKTIKLWKDIDSHLILLVFLPGLLFKDAFGLDFFLFFRSFGQLLIMAFPMVLAGTTLMALIGYYILPYDWSFNLSMTFGSILSATDPVAVSALLNELGAPPRLKMHIAGESLLNDGSAIVFFTIFKKLFLYEEGLHGGEEVDFLKGIEIFVRMSLGAMVVGSLFGIAQVLVMIMLRRRYSYEENVVEVTITIGVAYLSFFVAEIILEMSGVIAVVFCGIATKTFGAFVINDVAMMKMFWDILEHILNTILFVLGGVIWGKITLDQDAAAWGYLFVVYILMSIARFFLFAIFFPIISRIGLKSHWKEMVFHSFGGLRGAVGIALAIILDHEVYIDTVGREIDGTQVEDPRRNLVRKVYFFSGGIALLTLFINGLLAAPLLRKLKLGRASPEREKITRRYNTYLKRKALKYFVQLIGDPRFSNIDFEFIQKKVEQLEVITVNDIKFAVRDYKETTPLHNYREPNLSLLDSHFQDNMEEFQKIKEFAKVKLVDRFRSAVRTTALRSSIKEADEDICPEDMKEIRLVFVELLRQAYADSIKEGSIDPKHFLSIYLLLNSAALAEDDVSNGLVINDWKAFEDSVAHKAYAKLTSEKKAIVEKIITASYFIEAHNHAQKAFKEKFCERSMLAPAESKVLEESIGQIKLAQNALDSFSPELVKETMSVLVCLILLNDSALEVSEMLEHKLLKDAEAEHLIHHIDHQIECVSSSTNHHAKNHEDSVESAI